MYSDVMLVVVCALLVASFPVGIYFACQMAERIMQRVFHYLETAERVGEPRDLVEKRLALETERLRLQQQTASSRRNVTDVMG